jgi:hypothetical protein
MRSAARRSAQAPRAAGCESPDPGAREGSQRRTEGRRPRRSTRAAPRSGSSEGGLRPASVGARPEAPGPAPALAPFPERTGARASRCGARRGSPRCPARARPVRPASNDSDGSKRSRPAPGGCRGPRSRRSRGGRPGERSPQRRSASEAPRSPGTVDRRRRPRRCAVATPGQLSSSGSRRRFAASR